MAGRRTWVLRGFVYFLATAEPWSTRQMRSGPEISDVVGATEFATELDRGEICCGWQRRRRRRRPTDARRRRSSNRTLSPDLFFGLWLFSDQRKKIHRKIFSARIFFPEIYLIPIFVPDASPKHLRRGRRVSEFFGNRSRDESECH